MLCALSLSPLSVDSGEAAIAACAAKAPDLVLMDVRLPGIDGACPLPLANCLVIDQGTWAQFIVVETDESAQSTANVSNRQLFRSVTITFGNGRDDFQVLGMNLFRAPTLQACKSCRHDELDLIAKAFEQTLQLKGISGFCDRSMKVNRETHDVRIRVVLSSNSRDVQRFGIAP
jgi:CheY-like chemotaxis protein